MASLEEHLRDWRELWEKTKAVAARYCPNDEFTAAEPRETFEFVRTALVYHRNCLAGHDNNTLHGLLRSPARRLWTNNTLLKLPGDPLFRDLSNPAFEATRGLFIASASVRVAVGVLAAIKMNGSTFPFTNKKPPVGKVQEAEWNRDSAESAFEPVKKLGHCDGPALGSTPEETRKHAGVIVLVHRDNFGHGEVGVGKPYRAGREEVLNQLHVCRLLEAQRVLIKWSLDEFR